MLSQIIFLFFNIVFSFLRSKELNSELLNLPIAKVCAIFVTALTLVLSCIMLSSFSLYMLTTILTEKGYSTLTAFFILGGVLLLFCLLVCWKLKVMIKELLTLHSNNTKSSKIKTISSPLRILSEFLDGYNSSKIQ